MAKQSEIIAFLNSFPTSATIVECTDEFCSCDGESENRVLEIKSRRSSYEEWVIEGLKFIKNLNKALDTGKEFIYVNEYKGEILVWNINNLVENNFDFKWDHNLMPDETDFSDSTKKIWKIVGYLPTHLAVFSAKMES
jgi:hypothetical protein